MSKMKISINQSSMEELTKLKGVGLKFSARIIQYREDGPFSDLEDITHRVPGISSRTIRSWNEQEDVVVTFDHQDIQNPNHRAPYSSEQDVDDMFHFTIPKRCCIVLSICTMLVMLALVVVGVAMTRTWQSDKAVVQSDHPNKWKNAGYPFEPIDFNSSVNHTIYLECMDDGDCSSGQGCFAGKLQPDEKPFNIWNRNFKNDTLWVKSKFGVESLMTRPDGWWLRNYIGMYSLETGRRCWDIATEVGDDCGGEINTICDAASNLTCVYGKCTKSNDQWLLRGIMGEQFVASNNEECDSVEHCLEPHPVERGPDDTRRVHPVEMHHISSL